MKRSTRRMEWRGFLVCGLLIFGAPGLAVAQNTFPASGNVGVGTATPVGTTANILHIDATAGGQLHLTSGANSGTTTGDGSFITHYSDNNLYITNMEGAGILLNTNGGAERMRVTPTGNVGIGIGAPTGTTANVLHVDATAGGQLHLTSGANSGGTSGDGSYITHYSDNNLYITNMENAAVVFGTNAGAQRMSVSSAGLRVFGDAQVDGNLAAKYQDVAEWVRTATPLPAGVVVVIDVQHQNRVLPASGPYDTRIAGVVSARPGLLLGEAGDDKVKVAHSGRVKVKVDASYGPIATGDLLVTSPTSGHAMRSTPVELGGTAIHRPGTLLGKALEPLADGQGEILVLLTIQ
jgi:hypothetical protein